jgi:hypothetical protein
MWGRSFSLLDPTLDALNAILDVFVSRARDAEEMK